MGVKLTDYQTSKIVGAIFSKENVPAIVELATAIVEESKKIEVIVEKEVEVPKEVETIFIGDGQGFGADAIKELIKQTEDLQTEIDTLKGVETENASLKKELEDLKLLIEDTNKDLGVKTEPEKAK